MIHAAIYNILKDDATVSSLVSQRIYPGQAGDDSMPYIVYHVLFGGDVTAHTEGAGDKAQVTVQVDCVGETELSAVNVAKAARTALAGFEGTNGSVNVHSVQWTDTTDVPNAPFKGEAQGIKQLSLDFSVIYDVT